MEDLLDAVEALGPALAFETPPSPATAKPALNQANREAPLSEKSRRAARLEKSKRAARLEFDRLPPVELRHMIIDMGSFVLFITGLLVPFTCFKFIAHWQEDFMIMASITIIFIFLQYWIIAGYFMICEAMGLCDDMFILDPKKRISFWQGAPQVLRNQVVGSVYSAVCWYLVARRDWSAFTTMPTILEILKYTVQIAMFWSEIWMYITHRLLHTPMFMSFHKTHHEQNNVSLTVAWGARYCSLVEDIVCNVSAVSVFAYWHCVHPAFITSWVAHTQWNVIVNHTGYHEKYLPFSAMMAGMVHHNHHANGQSDFGTTVGWADWLFNTKGPNHPGSLYITILDAVWVGCGGKSKL